MPPPPVKAGRPQTDPLAPRRGETITAQWLNALAESIERIGNLRAAAGWDLSDNATGRFLRDLRPSAGFWAILTGRVNTKAPNDNDPVYAPDQDCFTWVEAEYDDEGSLVPADHGLQSRTQVRKGTEGLLDVLDGATFHPLVDLDHPAAVNMVGRVVWLESSEEAMGPGLETDQFPVPPVKDSKAPPVPYVFGWHELGCLRNNPIYSVATTAVAVTVKNDGDVPRIHLPDLPSRGNGFDLYLTPLNPKPIDRGSYASLPPYEAMLYASGVGAPFVDLRVPPRNVPNPGNGGDDLSGVIVGTVDPRLDAVVVDPNGGGDDGALKKGTYQLILVTTDATGWLEVQVTGCNTAIAGATVAITRRGTEYLYQSGVTGTTACLADPDDLPPLPPTITNTPLDPSPDPTDMDVVAIFDNAGGALEVGTYYLKYTYLMPDADDVLHESLPSGELAVTVTTAGQVPRIGFFGTLPKGVAYVNIYLTAVNGQPGTECLYAGPVGLHQTPGWWVYDLVDESPVPPPPPTTNVIASLLSSPAVAATVDPVGCGTTGGALQPGHYSLRYTFVMSDPGGSGRTLETDAGTNETPFVVSKLGQVPQVTLPKVPAGIGFNLYLTCHDRPGSIAVASGTTDANGTFNYPIGPQGAVYDVTASLEGYFTQSRTVTAPGCQRTVVSLGFQLDPAVGYCCGGCIDGFPLSLSLSDSRSGCTLINNRSIGTDPFGNAYLTPGSIWTGCYPLALRGTFWDAFGNAGKSGWGNLISCPDVGSAEFGSSLGVRDNGYSTNGVIFYQLNCADLSLTMSWPVVPVGNLFSTWAACVPPECGLCTYIGTNNSYTYDPNGPNGAGCYFQGASGGPPSYVGPSCPDFLHAFPGFWGEAYCTATNGSRYGPGVMIPSCGLGATYSFLTSYTVPCNNPPAANLPCRPIHLEYTFPDCFITGSTTSTLPITGTVTITAT